MKRITTDNPQTSTEAMLNMARAENGEVMLGFGDEVVTLAEYVSKYAKETGCDVTQESVMDGDNCVECDCPVAILNILGIQAAENNARLKMIEKILGNDYDLDRLKELVEADREGRCVVLPVKPRETFYTIDRVSTLCHLGCYFDDCDCQGCEEDFCDSKLEFEVKKNTGCSKRQVLSLIEDQKKIYLSEQDAEAALKAMKESENDG